MSDEDKLSTADLAMGSERRPPDMPAPGQPAMDTRQPPVDARAMPAGEGSRAEPLAALFPQQMSDEFRRRWDEIQIGFVDDPRRAVQQADELVAQVMKNLAESFAQQRSQLEANLGQGGQQPANTEDLRVALRGYRSFFSRLLSM